MIFLVGSIFFIVLSVYGVLVYRAWQIRSRSIAVKNEPEEVGQLARRLISKMRALVRHLVDRLAFFTGKLFLTTSNMVRKFLLKLFPRLRLLLEPKDKLLGLYRGPASAFLANVAKYKEEVRPVRTGNFTTHQ